MHLLSPITESVGLYLSRRYVGIRRIVSTDSLAKPGCLGIVLRQAQDSTDTAEFYPLIFLGTAHI